MSHDVHIHCGIKRVRKVARDAYVKHHWLQIGKDTDKVHVDVHYLPNRLATTVSSVALDLMEVAAYVFTADQLCTRGGPREVEYGTRRRRSLRFTIAVRDPDLWNSKRVNDALRNALGFMSDDDYAFEFVRNAKPASTQSLFRFEDSDPSPPSYRSAMLFSGGLDSLGGAVREIIQNRCRTVLISHASTSKIAKPQTDLVHKLIASAAPGTPRPLHVQYTVNKGKSLGRDTNQRTRSFLFCSFAAIIARMLGLPGFKVYENGVISINLSPSMHVLGSRASRTTHPRTMHLMREFLNAVFSDSVAVETPFMWKTKADVLAEIKAAGLGSLCAHAISCAHTIARTVTHTHCGTCSQCVDRRLAALAADLAPEDDPATSYRTTPIDPIVSAPDVSMIEGYIAAARTCRAMKDANELLERHGELGRLLRHTEFTSTESLGAVFKLHRSHANSVICGLQKLVQSYSSEVATGTVPPKSLLGLALIMSDEAVSAPSEASSSRDGSFVVDPDRFQASFQGKSVTFGNTVQFRLLHLLAAKVGKYWPVGTINSKVWGGDDARSAAIHKAVSLLRGQIQPLGPNVVIDGSKSGHYALLISANGKE
jgi:7-cyano-7-deazaguanine synthase in queuosine biosynthesis